METPRKTYRSVLQVAMSIGGGRIVRKLKKMLVRKWYARRSGVDFNWCDEVEMENAVRIGRAVVRSSSVLILLVCLAAQAAAVDLTKLGSFRVPTTGTAPNSLAYSRAKIAFKKATTAQPRGTLFISGHDQGAGVAEISIPDYKLGAVGTLPRAEFVQATRQLTHNSNGNVTGNVKNGGLLVVDDRLLEDYFIFYDANGTQNASHGRLPGTLLTQKGEGLFRVGSLNAGFYSGPMCLVPEQNRAKLGGSVLTGNGILSIISRTSSGPALFAINPADFGVKNPVPATPLVYYTLEHKLADPETKNPLYTRADFYTGCVALEDSVICFGSHGTGDPWYGENGDIPGRTDPARTSKGEHAYPYKYWGWEYSNSDLEDVKNGFKQPWDPRPKPIDLNQYFYTGVGDDEARWGCGAAYDPATRRLFLSQPYGEQTQYDPYPVIHVFQVNATTPPVDTTPPVITNVQIVDVTQTTATVTWTTDEASDTRVEFGTSTSYGAVAVKPESVTSHSFTLDGLTPGTPYNLRVKSWDNAPVRNSATSANYTFTTLAPEPVDPTIELLARIAQLESQLAAVQEQLSASQSSNVELTQQVASLQSDFNRLQAWINDVKAKVSVGP